MMDESDRSGDRGTSPVHPRAPRSVWRRTAKGLLPLLILGAGAFAMSYLKHASPTAQRRPPQEQMVLVQVEPLRPSDQRVTVSAMGSVIAAAEIVLKSRVSGEVVAISPDFAEGGFLKAGQEILRIDPQDYRLDIQRKQGAVVSARYALKLEMGHQDVAQREWELLNQGKPADPRDLELALRKPHLEKARADLAAAEADLKRARLDLERTRVVSPFNAIVRSESVEVGSQVAAQEQLAELVGTDAYWVKASIPVDRLGWIRIPREADGEGSPARVFYGDRQEAAGRVIKLLGDLEAAGRMARILVQVDDPLGLETGGYRPTPLLIGDYVRVDIEGRELKGVYRIPRAALRDNERIWLMDGDGRLEIREVETLWRDADTVLVRDGLSPGDLLVTSDLAVPVAGMALSVASPGGPGGAVSDSAPPAHGRG